MYAPKIISAHVLTSGSKQAAIPVLQYSLVCIYWAQYRKGTAILWIIQLTVLEIKRNKKNPIRIFDDHIQYKTKTSSIKMPLLFAKLHSARRLIDYVT